MKTSCLLLAVLLSFAGFAAGQTPPAAIAGLWEGSVNLPGTALGVFVTLNLSGTAWTGTVDIPAQGAKGLPLGGIVVSGQSIAFVLPSIPGQPSFNGTVASDGKSISGTFSQNGATFPFSLSRPVPDEIVDGGRILGNWEGTIPVGGRPIRLVFKAIQAADGSIRATFASPDQGSPDLPVTRLSFKNSVLYFNVPAVQGSFEGTLDAAGTTINGNLTQGITQPLVLKKAEKPAALIRPQEPKRPFPYEEVDITYTNTKAGITLAGTLTHPMGTPPFPAVLLVTGSGAQDRDESLLGHKPFLVLSDYLTRKGIAVLRVDDRGVGASTGNLAVATTMDLAGDASAGIQFLKSRKEIDSRRVGVIGHSEGGAIAPLVASQSDDVAFIVLLAGPGLPGEDILYSQAERIAKVSGASRADLASQRKIQEQYYAVVKSGADLPTMEARLRALGNPEPAAILSPWFRFFLTYDPRPALTKTKCAVLAIGGGNDLQVPVHENLAAIESALRAGGNKDYKTVVLPKLNHLFQTSDTGSPSEYGVIEETMSPLVLKLVSDWIVQHTAR